MARDPVPDDLWGEFRPHLPPHPPQPRGGQKPADDRACLRGIIHVLETGSQWQKLPTSAFGVSGSTCWRRFRDWTRAGVWSLLHRSILDRLGKLGEVDWTRNVIDSASVRAVLGGPTPGPTPRTAAKTAASATPSAMPGGCRW